MKLGKAGKVLIAVNMVLAASLAARSGVSMLNDQPHTHRYHVSWKNRPEKEADGNKLAKHIVEAQVVKIEASTMELPIKGEEGGKDVIPIEVVTMEVSDTLKGKVPKTIEVFNTGDSKNNISLENNPPYKRGERYLMYLDNGPKVRVKGKVVQTVSAISPEGRMAIDNKGNLKAVSKRGGMAQELNGKSLKTTKTKIKGNRR